MTGVGDRPNTFDEYIRITNKRIVSLERDLYRSGAIDLTNRILAGPGIDITGTGTIGDPMIIATEGVIAEAFPDPIRYGSGSSHTVAATAWGTILPGTVAQSMSVNQPLWVLVTLGAWLISSAGETRGGVTLSGATVLSPPQTAQSSALPVWGQTLLTQVQDTSTGSGQRTLQRLLLLNAGTTTFQIEAYLVTAGTHQMNYPTLEVIPLAWAGVPAPIPVSVGSLTKRTSTSGQAVTSTAQVLDWNVAVADSGHFTFDAALDEFSCVVPGTYTLRLSVGFSSVAAANYGRALMDVNAVVENDSVITRNTTGLTSYVASTKTLVVGDKVRARFLGGTAGGTIDTAPARTFVELVPVTA